MKFRVDLAITVDVDAPDAAQAEVMALEQLNMPGIDIIDVHPLDDECPSQMSLFGNVEAVAT